MSIRRFKETLTRRFFKIALSVFVYIFFTIFTIPLYQQVPILYKKAHVFINEKILSNKRNIVVGNTTLLVDIADTKEKRIQGLSGVSQLPARGGMLFIFDKPDFYGFWMKDMNFDLDIIWFNEYGEIIYIVHDAKPESFPETFMSPKKSLYVLEVPAGFVKKEGLKIGDKIDLY